MIFSKKSFEIIYLTLFSLVASSLACENLKLYEETSYKITLTTSRIIINSRDFKGQFASNHEDIRDQSWIFKSTQPSNYYQIISASTGKALDEGNKSDSTVKQLEPCIPSDINYGQQLWRIERVEGEGNYIISKSGSVLEYNVMIGSLGKITRKTNPTYCAFYQWWSLDPVLSLHEAVSRRDLEKVTQILQKNPKSLSFQDLNGWTSLHIAAENNDPDIIVKLLYNKDFKKLKKLLSMRNNKGDTPFHVAAYNGHHGALAKLIELYEEGKNLNGYNDFTPLHTAVSQGHIELVKFLVEEKGVDLERRDKNENTVLHLAQLQKSKHKEKEGQYDKIIEYLAQEASQLIIMSAREVGTPLHYAAMHELLNQLNIFLQKENVIKAIDTRDEDGVNGATPLQRAVISYKSDAAKLLVESGANVTAYMKFSGTLLHYIHSLDLLKILLSRRNVDINCKTYGSCTPLHEAAKWNKVEIAKYLIDQGANVNAHTDEGHTPLHLAVLSKKCSYEPTEIVNYLIDHGAKAEEPGQYGGTIFHCAAFLGYDSWKWLESLFSESSFKILAVQNDAFYKRPIDLLNFQTIFPSPKQMMQTNCGISKRHWQVSLFFTDNKSSCYSYIPPFIHVDHAMVAFESVDDDQMDYTFRYTHKMNDISFHLKKGIDSSNSYLAQLAADHRVHDIFQWQIDEDIGKRVWQKITNKMIYGNNCIKYALTVLKECCIPLPKFPRVFGTDEIRPESAIKAFHNFEEFSEFGWVVL